MSTPTQDLHASIRLLLGDTGTTAVYTSDQLDLALSWAVKEDEVEGGSFTLADDAISPDVVNAKDFLRLCVRSALALVDPQSNPLYYKFAGVTVWRQNGMFPLVQSLRDKLRKLVDASAEELVTLTEWNQYLSGTYWQLSKSLEVVQ